MNRLLCLSRTRLGLLLAIGCLATMSWIAGVNEAWFSARAQESNRPGVSLTDVPKVEPAPRVMAGGQSTALNGALGPEAARAHSRIAATLCKRPGEHPLNPVLRWARAELADIKQIRDYSAILVRRELVHGRLRECERIQMKVRHEPFSVYLRFLAPVAVKGQECLYVVGQHNGKLLARPPGLKGSLLGVVELKPTNPIAQACGHPITDVGIRRLIEQLIEVGEQDLRHDDCAVRLVSGETVNGRGCACLEITHQWRQDHFTFHVARIYIDLETNLPIRYESDGWPATASGTRPRIDDYTYERLTTNLGLTDDDFSTSNQAYGFRKWRDSE
ncbi:MAG: DUF1571 domain-containing protein [Planctomycetes bacterium]|nr:DUF1571 domain-containing protein [Planctomycetota bacterium]